MTLATVPRYDPERLSDVGTHAVVIGGSVAGLLAARILDDGFDTVTIIERDPIPDDTSTRRGVPQGQHVHVLETAGRDTFEDLFPGYGEELLSSGGLIIDLMSDFHHYEKGDFLAAGPNRMTMYNATRPLFEEILRRRVAARDDIDFRDRTQFITYRLDETTTGVEGVTVRDDRLQETFIPADLVVDASGRASKTPSWLDDHGFEAPDVEEVQIDLAYSTVMIERPEDDRRNFFVPPEPDRTRGVGMFPVEDGSWQTTLLGVHGNHPPTEADELITFAEGLPIPVVGRLLDRHPWVSDEVAHYPFPSNRRLRYEGLDRFPDDLVVVGDALCSFNPIYGQGMSVAALEALQLHHTLASAGRDGVGRRFFERAAAIVDSPWSIAVGGDFEFPETTGSKPRGTDFVNWYLDRLVRAAHSDGKLREALIRVFMLERPPESLLRPATMWRVFKPT
jgi:2-polyprenyl-6-methoxyphenol hydroxylase-like FAD-dependent oxidoreductase